MTDQQKLQAAKLARDYATEKANAGLLTERYKEKSWMDDVKPYKIGQEITTKVVSDTLDSAMSGMWSDMKKGFITDESSADLEAAYDIFSKQNSAVRREITDGAEGNAAKYFEMRENGLSHDDYIAVSDSVFNAVGTGKIDLEDYDRAKRDIDIMAAIAATPDLSEAETDIAMKAYMDDYNAPYLDYDLMSEHGFSGAESATIQAAIDKARGTGTKDLYTGQKRVTETNVRDALVKNTNLSKQEIDIVMAIYWPNSARTEKKYDAVRDAEFTAQQYVDAYYAYLDNSNKRDKIRAIQEAVDVDYKTAAWLYKAFYNG